jgi:hypothetical protein
MGKVTHQTRKRNRATYQIALPTYNRVDTLIEKTLAALDDHHIDPARITIFVANDQQKDLYEQKISKDLYGKIVVGVKGLANVRNFITEYYPLGTEVVSLDDDISNFMQLNQAGDKLVPLRNLHRVIEDGFKLCKKLNYHMWGLSPVKNAFFMKNQISTNLKFIIGNCYGFINRRIKVHSDFKDDYELSLENSVRDGGVIRFNNIVATTKLGAKGGNDLTAEQRAKQKEHKDFIEFLKKKYPGLVRDNPRRPMEILLSRSLESYTGEKKIPGSPKANKKDKDE